VDHNNEYSKMKVKLPVLQKHSRWRTMAFVTFVVVLTLFLFASSKAGVRCLGVMMSVGAGVKIVMGRIPYGWDGREPSGYITGFPAVLVGLLMAILGIVMVMQPDLMLALFGWTDT
jgi:hypothetical protein